MDRYYQRFFDFVCMALKKYLYIMLCTWFFTTSVSANSYNIDNIKYTDRDFVVGSLAMFKQKLPISVSHGIILTDIIVDVDEVVFVNMVSDELAKQAKAQITKLALSDYACGEDSRYILDNGFSVTFAYYDRQLRYITDVTYTKQDCDFYDVFFGN